MLESGAQERLRHDWLVAAAFRLRSMWATGHACFAVSHAPVTGTNRHVFNRQVTELIDRVKATPRQAGIDEIRIPSERAFRSRERAPRRVPRSFMLST